MPQVRAVLKFRNVADQAMLMVYLVTHEELLEALQRHMPTSVLFDGQEVPGVEMVELIKEALRLSTKDSPIRSIPDCVLPLEQKLYRLPRVDSAATPRSRSRVSGVAHGHYFFAVGPGVKHCVRPQDTAHLRPKRRGQSPRPYPGDRGHIVRGPTHQPPFLRSVRLPRSRGL